jgi:hypothetical protein
VSYDPNQNGYHLMQWGSHFRCLKFHCPLVRSSQIVGISATGRRSRRALDTNSRPTSKRASEPMPIVLTNSVEYALKEFVLSRVPTRAKRWSESPSQAFHDGQ